MIKKTKIDGMELDIDDGNPNTEHLTELHGELREEADTERLKWLIKQLKSFGYKVVKE